MCTVVSFPSLPPKVRRRPSGENAQVVTSPPACSTFTSSQLPVCTVVSFPKKSPKVRRRPSGENAQVVTWPLAFMVWLRPAEDLRSCWEAAKSGDATAPNMSSRGDGVKRGCCSCLRAGSMLRREVFMPEP